MELGIGRATFVADFELEQAIKQSVYSWRVVTAYAYRVHGYDRKHIHTYIYARMRWRRQLIGMAGEKSAICGSSALPRPLEVELLTRSTSLQP